MHPAPTGGTLLQRCARLNMFLLILCRTHCALLCFLYCLTTGSLFDPRVPALRAVLDHAQCFPCAPFDSPRALDAMAGLGLQSTATLQVRASAIVCA